MSHFALSHRSPGRTSAAWKPTSEALRNMVVVFFVNSSKAGRGCFKMRRASKFCVPSLFYNDHNAGSFFYRETKHKTHSMFFLGFVQRSPFFVLRISFHIILMLLLTTETVIQSRSLLWVIFAALIMPHVRVIEVTQLFMPLYRVAFYHLRFVCKQNG